MTIFIIRGYNFHLTFNALMVFATGRSVGALAEFERDIIRERTQAGLQAARARGRLGGRPKAKALNTPKKITLAQSLYNDKNNTIDEICKTLNISRATLYRYIKIK
jgi:DNA invertase Pin-like site-specific DNA recombinase